LDSPIRLVNAPPSLLKMVISQVSIVFFFMDATLRQIGDIYPCPAPSTRRASGQIERSRRSTTC
jgi:hypothetical protein